MNEIEAMHKIMNDESLEMVRIPCQYIVEKTGLTFKEKLQANSVIKLENLYKYQYMVRKRKRETNLDKAMEKLRASNVFQSDGHARACREILSESIKD